MTAGPTHNLRPYQAAAVTATLRALWKNPILVLPTGGGKTLTATHVIRSLAGRTLWVAHRRELIHQAARHLHRLGLDVGLIMAGADADQYRRSLYDAPTGDVKCYVASIQTLKRRQLPPETQLIVVDECHHATSDSYADLFTLGVPVVGLTATPFRLDGKPLGGLFGDIIVGAYPDELIRDGYLVAPRVFAGAGPDLHGIEITAGDYNKKQLDHRINQPILVGDIVKTWTRHARSAAAQPQAGTAFRTVCYAASIEHSRRIVAQFAEAGVAAAHLDGTTPADERDGILARLADGHTEVVSNYGVLCLDEATEVLTAGGWRGIDDVSKGDQVANWRDGSIWFGPTKEIVRRERMPNERMVVLETLRRSIRVTEGHWMLYRTRHGGRFFKQQARLLVNRAVSIPVSGVACPFPDVVEREPASRSRHKRLVTKTAFNIRKSCGCDQAASRVEAERRVSRRLSLRSKSANELTQAECELIGFWIGDGSVTRLARGGLEYTITQSKAYPAIIERIDALLSATGIHNIRRDRIHVVPHVRWSMPRGTGGGRQERRGVYAVERFLNKSQFDWLWSLDRSQFASFAHGFWLADGDHRDGRRHPFSYAIHNTNLDLLSTIQAVAVCRGWLSSVRRGSNPAKNPKHKQNYILLLRPNTDGHAMTAHRFRFEGGWKRERVWCVKTESRNIITRRRGTVTVMGNTEGWDLPALECAIIARPTASACLHLQMVGRVLRPADGKAGAVVLDHAGNHHRHGPVTRRLEYSLDGPVKVSREQPAGALGMRHCKECLLLVDVREKACPGCGADVVAAQVYEPRSIDGELVEFDETSHAYRANAWDQIRREQAEAGYSDGWARHRFNERFGQWPLTADLGDGPRLIDPANASMAEKRAIYEDLLTFARSRGFKDGFASHKYREVFGTWPTGFVREVRDSDVAAEVERRLQRR